jgi:hypothetical protein
MMRTRRHSKLSHPFLELVRKKGKNRKATGPRGPKGKAYYHAVEVQFNIIFKYTYNLQVLVIELVV